MDRRVSAFAGRLVELRIGSRAPDERVTLIIDDIRFLLVAEPSIMALLGVGMLLVPLAAAWSRARRAVSRASPPTPRCRERASEAQANSRWLTNQLVRR